MKLTKNFRLSEFTRSAHAESHNIPNEPSEEILQNIQRVAEQLEVVRKILGNSPIRITSGYRSPLLNKAVGGVPTSAHVSGWAVDFICPQFGIPYTICQAIVAVGLGFDQLIHEYGRWCHISFDPTKRRQALTIFSGGRGYLSGIWTEQEYRRRVG